MRRCAAAAVSGEAVKTDKMENTGSRCFYGKRERRAYMWPAWYKVHGTWYMGDGRYGPRPTTH
eukprot:scaffold230756_cov27-Tisochrysis_lutea.AAC.1